MLDYFKKLKYYTKVAIATGLLFLFLGSAFVVASENTIQIVTEEGFPLNYLAEDGHTIIGYGTELVRAVMDDTGLKYHITVKPWTRAFREASTDKNTLIYSIGRIPDRESNFIWLGKIITVKNKIYGLNHGRDTEKITLGQLKNSNISVAKHSLNYDYLTTLHFKNLIFVNSYEQTFELLQRKRIEYFTSSVLGLHQFLKKNNLKTDDIIPVMSLHSSNPTLYLAANVDTDEEIVRKIQASYQKIVDSGVYNKIMKSILDEQKVLHKSTTN